MDLTTIENQLQSLRRVDIPDRPRVTDLARRTARRRNRRRAMGSAIALVVVGLGVGAFRLMGDGAQQLQTHDQGTTTTSTGGSKLSVRVPPVVGKSVGEAASLLEGAGLELAVSDGDAAFTNAIVVAAEPGETAEVPSGAVVGVRTALPDPPLSVECPLARHPRNGENADSLPHADDLDRISAEAAVRALRSSVPDPSDTEVFLGVWDRWAYTAGNGTITTAATPGFQAIVVIPDASGCSTTPSFQTVPVTYVFGDLAWAGDPFGQDLEAQREQASETAAAHAKAQALRNTSLAFIAFANRDRLAAPEEVPLAEEIRLGLGSALSIQLTGTDRLDRSAWALEANLFKARAGPISPLDLIRDRRVAATTGDHPGCAGAPSPPPTEVATLDRISLQPTTSGSCLDWFAVDLFLDDTTHIVAITVDLYEP